MRLLPDLERPVLRHLAQGLTDQQLNKYPATRTTGWLFHALTEGEEEHHMTNALEQAALDAAEHGAPPKVWDMPETAAVEFATGRNPFDGATFTAWDHSDVAAGRSE